MDILSISCGEVTAKTVKCLPNGIVVGERTFGATCVLNSDFDEYYSGTFGNRNGNHYVYTPTYLTKDINGNILEGYGITPDVDAVFSEDNYFSGIDNQLMTAIEIIKAH